MPGKPAHPPLNVFLNNRLVGQLRRQANGAVDFQYDTGWLAWEYAMPVSYSLPLRENRYIGAPVMAVFDNLLPDNREIRSRVAARMGASGTDAYSLLSAVGRDCVGALQFLPDHEEPNALDEIRGEELDEKAIAAILSNLKAVPLGLDKDRDFRISIAGAQEKTAFTRWQGKWLLPHPHDTHLPAADWRTAQWHRSDQQRRKRVSLHGDLPEPRTADCSMRDRAVQWQIGSDN